MYINEIVHKYNICIYIFAIYLPDSYPERIGFLSRFCVLRIAFLSENEDIAKGDKECITTYGILFLFFLFFEVRKWTGCVNAAPELLMRTKKIKTNKKKQNKKKHRKMNINKNTTLY